MNYDTRSRGIIIFLLIALIAIGLLSYQNAQDYSILRGAFVEEKNELKAELDKIIKDYDNAITSKINISSRLRKEKIKVVQLRDSIDVLKEENYSLIRKYRKRISNLEKQNKLLFVQVDSLKDENTFLKVELTEKEKLSNQLAQTNQKLKNTKRSLEDKVAIASNLEIDDVIITPLKKRSNGKYTSTSRSRKVEAFKITFDILKNGVAKKGQRKIYIQILDTNKNVISPDGHIALRNKQKIVYSAVFNADYNNQQMSLVNLVNVEKGHIKKGNYIISTYIEGELMSRKVIKLK